MGVDRDALRRLANALPNGSAVPMPREWVLELLADTQSPEPDRLRLPVDLTPEEAGKALQRSPVTIRAYCNAGLFPGAYRLRGRQWRIPPSAIAAFQAAEQRAHQERPEGHAA